MPGILLASGACLLFLGMLVAAAWAAERKVYVGTLKRASTHGMEIEQSTSTVHIGFFGDAAALAQLGRVRVGDPVRVVLGTGIPLGGTRETNQLLSIRRCERRDRQCAADMAAEVAAAARRQQKAEAFSRRMAACNRAMQVSLQQDPRYAPPADLEPAEIERARKRLAAFSGEQRACARRMYTEHETAVLEACRRHHCGDEVGGGCYHIAGYSLTEALSVRTAARCAAPSTAIHPAREPATRPLGHAPEPGNK